jgi:hypothetical protein
MSAAQFTGLSFAFAAVFTSVAVGLAGAVGVSLLVC